MMSYDKPMANNIDSVNTDNPDRRVEKAGSSRMVRVLGRFLPIALLAAMTPVISLPSAMATDAYSDIPSGIHEESVSALAEEGILAGTECEPGRICPDSSVQRWTMAVWLSRAVDGTEPPAVTSTRFTDVDPATDWWAPHVERLAVLDITKGCASSRYCPDTDVTRQQMASFLVRAFDLESAGSFGFTDTGSSSHAADIDALAAAGITNGCSQNPLRFCPGETVTRAQMATFLARALNLVDLPGDPSSTGATTTTTTPDGAGATGPTGSQTIPGDLNLPPGSHNTAPPPPSPRESQSLGQIQVTRVPATAALEWYEQPANIQTRGEHFVDVFYCDPKGRFKTNNLSDAVELLDDTVGLFYQWQSSGLFEFTFRPGRILRPTTAQPCINQIRNNNLSASYLIISDDHDRVDLATVNIARALAFKGWTGERGSKAAVLWGSSGPTGLEVDSIPHRDYYLISVIDALAHTHLAVGHYPAGLGGNFGACVGSLLSSILSGSFTAAEYNLGRPKTPQDFDGRIALSCLHIHLLGWPRTSTNCVLLHSWSTPEIREFTVGEGSATLKWDPPNLLSYDRPLTGYYVILSNVTSEGVPDEIIKLHRLDAAATQLTMTGLSPIIHHLELYPLYAALAEPFTIPFNHFGIQAPAGQVLGEPASSSIWVPSEGRYRSYKNSDRYNIRRFTPRLPSTTVKVTDGNYILG